MHHEWRRGGYVVSTDPERLDLQVIHAFLTASYWAAGIPLDVVRRSLEHSVNFGLYREQAAAAAGGAREARRDAAPDVERARGEQVGFARVITDRATFGYLGDVFVLPAHRGRGLSKWLMQCIDEHPELKGFRRWVLLTRDAHGLYRQFGWTPVASPERYMERWAPDVYAAAPAAAGPHQAS